MLAALLYHRFKRFFGAQVPSAVVVEFGVGSLLLDLTRDVVACLIISVFGYGNRRRQPLWESVNMGLNLGLSHDEVETLVVIQHLLYSSQVSR
jgi:hypothetical protein